MSDRVYVLVSNIPPVFHTLDLRRFFSDFVENDKFICFHYRHRPHKQEPVRNESDNNTSTIIIPAAKDKKISEQSEDKSAKPIEKSARTGVAKTFGEQVTGRVHQSRDQEPPDRPSCCCVVQLDAQHVNSFLTSFHRKHWLDSTDTELDTRCFIAKIANDKHSELSILPEQRPPNIMPRGNVGTSTKFFLEAIRDCRLPAKLIGKLGLEFPKSKHRKYGEVPFEYAPTRTKGWKSLDRTKLQALNTAGPRIEVGVDAGKEDSGAEDDDDTCEEWERHEALHDDVHANRTIGRQVNSSSYLAEGGDLDQQPGTKEKPFEEEIELVWEKGGSGLNFYTDAQYWKAQEGDFDEQTTDDWDVDMSVYYEKNTVHDMDAVDRYDMRRSEFLRAGKHSESVFKKRENPQTSKPGPSRPTTSRGQHRRGLKRQIGDFEVYTIGVGGRIMKEAGWKEGMGLGAKNSGIPTAIDGEEDGQGTWNKRGLGYHGQKIVFAPPRPPVGPPPQPPAPGGIRISSVYSRPEQLDQSERVERSNPKVYVKFRDQPIKFLAAGIEGGNRNIDI
ncbi:G patch domain-containing protein 3 isoform X3 [Eurytemora carolleeae]|uniref:G patch domain-containing protein 3 isoform X3 n=1 Tax=Eurytemora carolleeae TaxID=1294199 RepID=UPI000C768EA1|nr:G patch domain-containing protein 3 isoform X3 [Eurytemora carolleeae]|eukprot:XP_023329281.1 G patch domain-containing protein 3-like isoform X3 [Eurytemora affinis]